MSGMIAALGRDGMDFALETLFAISDEALDPNRCARHSMIRILEILDDAFESDSSEEEA